VLSVLLDLMLIHLFLATVFLLVFVHLGY
jgi:hypothetical protein